MSNCCRYDGNNYTRRITFANATKKPIYMKVLNAIANAEASVSRSTVVKEVWKVDLSTKSHGWNCGPFTLLHKNGYIKYENKAWSITFKGRQFLNANWKN